MTLRGKLFCSKWAVYSYNTGQITINFVNNTGPYLLPAKLPGKCYILTDLIPTQLQRMARYGMVCFN